MVLVYRSKSRGEATGVPEMAVLRRPPDLEVHIGVMVTMLVATEQPSDTARVTTTLFSVLEMVYVKLSTLPGVGAYCVARSDLGLAKAAAEEFKSRIATLRETSEKQISDLQDRISKADVSLAETSAAAQKDKALLTSKMDFLESSLAESRANEETLKERERAVERARDEQVERLRTEARAREEELRGEIAEFRSKLSDAEHKASQLSETSALKGEMLQERLASMERQIATANEREKEQRAEYKAAKKELKKSFREQTDALTVKLEAAEKEAAVAQAGLESSAEAIKTLEGKLEEHRKAHEQESECHAEECARLKAERDKAIAQGESEVDTLQKALDDVRDKAKSNETKVEEMTIAASELVDQLAEERLSHEQELLALRDGQSAADDRPVSAAEKGLAKMRRLLLLQPRGEEEWQEKQKRYIGVANKLATALSESQAQVGVLKQEKRTHTKKLEEYWRRIQELERKNFRLEQQHREDKTDAAEQDKEES
mmetsp:Transcript_1916/g.3869  ORF Transcript_1916/g.3869 Transcript_1916/m.3869 type:complete len:489 (+) Transcript_1916:112-1578(+)